MRLFEVSVKEITALAFSFLLVLEACKPERRGLLLLAHNLDSLSLHDRIDINYFDQASVELVPNRTSKREFNRHRAEQNRFFAHQQKHQHPTQEKPHRPNGNGCNRFK